MTDQNAAPTPKENTPAASPAGTPVPPAQTSPAATGTAESTAAATTTATAAQIVPVEETAESPSPTRPKIRPHAFVVMPFGKKKGADGSLYDFNSIYKLMIKPALEEAGFEPFRADEETSSGDILTDMF